jgi:hypothetical protein
VVAPNLHACTGAGKRLFNKFKRMQTTHVPAAAEIVTNHAQGTSSSGGHSDEGCYSSKLFNDQKGLQPQLKKVALYLSLSRLAPVAFVCATVPAAEPDASYLNFGRPCKLAELRSIIAHKLLKQNTLITCRFQDLVFWCLFLQKTSH